MTDDAALDPVIQISVACALAVLWVTAGAHKAATFRAFRATVEEYRVLPRALAGPAAAIVIGLEAGLGIALLFPTGRAPALVGSAALLMLYAAVIGVNLLRGRRHIDCGCTGWGLRQPLSLWLIGRNSALGATALVVALPVESRVLLWVDAISIVATVCVLAAFYVTLNGLIANSRQLTGLGN